MREERIKKLVDNLERKLGIFTESATGPNDRDVTSSWRTICELEAEYVRAVLLSLVTDIFMILQRTQAGIIWRRAVTSHWFRVCLESEAASCHKPDLPWGWRLAAQRAREISCIQRDVSTEPPSFSLSALIFLNSESRH